MINPTLLHVFPSFAAGGIQMRLATLIAGLPKAWSHSVLSLNGDYSAIEGGRWPGNVARSDIVPPQSSNTLRRLQAIRKHLRASPANMLITNNWGSMEWAMAAGLGGAAAHIHTESGFGPDEAFSLNSKRNFMRRIFLRRAHAVLLCSQTLVDVAQDQWHLPQTSVRFVPDGIDLARFGAPGLKPLEFDFQTQAPVETVIGCVAPLRAEKNLTALLDAFDTAWKINPGLGLAIAGDGDERDTLMQHARGLASASNIHFFGFVREIERFYAGISVCALSSDTEQLPNSILQAMAARLPIAAFGVGDVPRMVAPENAPYIVPRRDIGGLSDAMLALAAAPAIRSSVGDANAAKCAAHYGQEAMVAAYKQAIEGGLERSQGAPQ